QKTAPEMRRILRIAPEFITEIARRTGAAHIDRHSGEQHITACTRCQRLDAVGSGLYESKRRERPLHRKPRERRTHIFHTHAEAFRTVHQPGEMRFLRHKTVFILTHAEEQPVPQYHTCAFAEDDVACTVHTQRL